ncbi:SipW-dependent-type signal peptide-containing protein, partial [[Clostridium] innocuum]|nr:SipW-dependent-type signal peptide-containing protein [[Clostridium] innocuum]
KVGILSIAALAGITVIGSSIAYFTSTDTKDNLFTVGSVRTVLHEDRWDDLADTDHNGIPDMAEDIIPNKTIPKDPTIENTGKNPAWVYLEVRVPIVNIITAQEDGSRNPKADTELFLFAPDLDHWRQLSKIVEE